VDPKTGKRVPIPPRLVAMLWDWNAEHDIKPGELMFRTRGGKRPTESNWSRALQGAHRRAKVHHIAVYDYRHAAATCWIRAGMPLAEAARRLGDSVETLVSYYINAMEGDEAEGNGSIEGP
jgi:integrase